MVTAQTSVVIEYILYDITWSEVASNRGCIVAREI